MIELLIFVAQPSPFATAQEAVDETCRAFYDEVTRSPLQLARDGRIIEKDREHIRWQLHSALMRAVEPFGDDVEVTVSINDPNLARGESVRMKCHVAIDAAPNFPPFLAPYANNYADHHRKPVIAP